MTRLLIAVTMFVSTAANAQLFEGWTTKEKVLFAVSEIAQVADYQTTRDLLYGYPKGTYYERNIFLGPHPSRAKLNLFQAASMAGNYFIADRLNHEDREKWLTSVILIEVLATRHNIQIGARINF